MTTNPKHIHECACGDYYVCSQRDNCPKEWQCPSCEMAERDRRRTLVLVDGRLISLAEHDDNCGIAVYAACGRS